TVAPTGVVSLAATGGAGALHESVLPIDGARLRVALPRIAIAPAPGRVDEEHRPRQDGDADLLGLERASAPLGNHPVAMGKPVPTAEDAVGGVARPVPRGIAPGWLRGLDAQLEDRAHATPETAIASGSGPEFVTREEKGEAGLRDLDAAELDSACCLALAGGLPAIADRRSATATTGVEEMPDELALRPGIDSLDRDPEAPRPPGEHAVGATRGQRLDDRLGDLLRAVVRRERDRRRRTRPDDGALFGLHGHGTERALVLRCARVDQVRQRHVYRRHRVGVRGIDEADHLRVALAQVHDEPVAALG